MTGIDLAPLVEQLRTTLGKMELALNAIEEAIVWADEAGRVEWCNAAFARLIQRPPILCIGSSLSHRLPLTSVEPAEPNPLHPLTQIFAGRYETTQYLFKDQILEISGNCFTLNQSRTAVLTIRDITERKQKESEQRQTQEMLQQQKQFLADLIDAAASIIIVKDWDNNILVANPVIAELEGTTVEKLITQGDTDIFPEEERLEFREQNRQVIRSGQEMRIQGERLIDSEGKVHWIDWIKRPITVPGRQDPCVLLVGADITIRQQIEQELLASQQMLRLVLDTIPQAIFWKDRELKYLGCNQVSAKTSGFTSPSEVIGKTDLEFNWPFEQAEQFMAMDRQVLETEEPLIGEISQIQSGDGQQIWVDYTRVPMHDHQGRVVGVLGVATNITERVIMEVALRQSESRLRAIVEAFPDLMLRVNHRGLYLELIKAPCSFVLTEPPEQRIGHYIYEFFPEDLAQQALGSIDLALKTGDVHICEYQVPGSDRYRETRWVACGEYEVLALVRDITERKRDEVAIYQQQQFLQNILDTSSTLMVVRDWDGRVVLFNRAAVEFLGRSSEEFLGTKLDACFDREISEELLGQNRQIIRSQQGLVSPLTVGYDHLGCERWLQWEKFPIQLPDGRFCVLVWGTDLTDRKLAEDALQESERRYRMLFENSIEGVFQISRQGQVVRTNTALARIMGYQTTAELNQTFLTYGPIHYVDPQRREELYQILDEQGQVYNFECQYYRADGEIIWVSQNSWAVKDQEGQIIYYEGFVQDITERKQAQQVLEQSLSLLRATLESTGDGILAVDLDQNILTYNQKFLELWGIDEESMRGDQTARFEQQLQQIRDPQTFVKRTAEITQSNEGNYEVIELRDGRIFERYTQPQRLGDQVIGRVWCYRDVTTAKQTERDLAESLSLLRATLESTADGILVVDLQGKVQIFNQKFLHMWDMPLELLSPAANSLERMEWLAEKTQAPEEFKNRIGELILERPHELARDLLHFKDGRVIERYSQPQWVGQQIRGRVWSFHDITEQRRAEATLRASEAKYRDLVQMPNSIIIRWDRQGQVRFVNEYGLRFFGYTEEQLIGQNVLGKIIPSVDSCGQDLRQLVQQMVENPEQYLINENENMRSSGERIWVTWANRPIRDEQGIMVEMLCVGTDSTQRRQAEEAMRQSEALLRTALGAARMGVWSRDLRTNEEHWSPELYEMFGVPQGQPVNYETFLNCIDPESRERELALEKRIMSENGDYHLEYQVPLPDGRRRWILSKGNYIRDQAGRPIKQAGANVDITPLKEAEAQLWRAKENAEAINRISQAIASILDLDTMLPQIAADICQMFDARNCGVGLFDSDGHELVIIADASASPNFPSTTGLHIPIHGNSSTEQVIQTKRAVIIQNAQTNPLTERIHEMMRSSGTQSILIAPLLARGEIIGTFAVDTDQEERHFTDEDRQVLETIGSQLGSAIENARLFKQMQQAREAAESANRAKSTFLANMSHELRTPLNAILGFAQLMSRDQQLSTKQRDSLSIINRSGEHLLNLINDVLEMSKIEAGRTVLHLKAFDLLHMIQSLQQMFQIRAKAKQLYLTVESSDTLPRFVRTDEGKLRQILINLLSNALKFTDRGKVVLRARACAQQPSRQDRRRQLCFEVEDTGRGIEKRYLNQLFQPFVQAGDRRGAMEGTGLGLAISYQFAQLLDGDITVNSQVAQGSRFRVQLWVDVADPEHVRERYQGRILGIANVETLKENYRILVVDDQVDNRNLLKLILTLPGLDVQTANNGQEAIERWQRWHPHLIWMDMRMPVMDGYEATRQIKADPKGQETIIIALTASAFEEHRIQVVDCGCDDFVGKPFQEKQIFTKLSEHLHIQFLSESTDQAPFDRRPDVAEDERSQDLAGRLQLLMPEDWLGALHEAALRVDGDRILDLLDQIPPLHADLAQELEDLIYHYDFESILALTESNQHDFSNE